MLNLLPVPKKVNTNGSRFCFSLDTYIVMYPMAGTLTRTAASQLQAEIKAVCGFAPMLTCGEARRGDIQFCLTQGTAQSYELSVTDDRIVLQAADEQGILHGVQTLRQIIRQSGWTLPGVAISDHPDLPVRGYYYDQTRGRIDTLDSLKKLADEACFYKLNQLQLYIEHTYLFRDIPELWAVAGTPLTPADIMQLDDYCAARGIELVPSLSSFGHLLELLRIKRFAGMCELEDADQYASTMFNRMGHHTIDPEDERSFKLISSLLDEYLPLFRSDKFNICSDETFDLGKGKNAGKDVGALYLGFLKQLCQHVAQRGKIPMFWGDIVLQYPQTLSELPQGAICLNWAYSPNVTEDGTRAFAETGAIQYVCPGVACWDHWLPDLACAYENIRRMASYGKKFGAVGLLNTAWGDYGHIGDPWLTLPGMVMGACAAWGVLPAREQLWHDLSQMLYGDASGRLVALMADISAAELIKWRPLIDSMDAQNGKHPHNADLPELPPIDADALDKADTQIDEALCHVRACGLHMPRENRKIIRNIMIYAEAIKLWNHVQAAIRQQSKDAALADKLARWLYSFEQVWRETSRESELWRIRQITEWHVNRLQ